MHSHCRVKQSVTFSSVYYITLISVYSGSGVKNTWLPHTKAFAYRRTKTWVYALIKICVRKCSFHWEETKILNMPLIKNKKCWSFVSTSTLSETRVHIINPSVLIKSRSASCFSFVLNFNGVLIGLEPKTCAVSCNHFFPLVFHEWD